MQDSEKITILQNDNKKINYVVHLADIHIHKRERDVEYREVFSRLCDDLKEKKLNNKNSVIVVCGDVVHDKTDLHPVSVELTRDFFVMLCEITDVVVIPGNHDVSLTNMEHNSLNSIIGKYMATKNNLFMLLNSGLYEYNNIIFGHTRFGDNVKVQRCTLKTKKYKCALYHGTLNNAVDDKGYQYKSTEDKKYLSTGDFADYDFVFLGDIHKMGFLKPHIAYPGSLIQQNLEEGLEKGYLLWNLEDEEGKFVRVHNDYGKVKVIIDEKGKFKLDMDNFPKFMDINIECKSMNRKDIDSVYNKLTINDITIVKKRDEFVNANTKLDMKLDLNGKVTDLSLFKNKSANLLESLFT